MKDQPFPTSGALLSPRAIAALRTRFTHCQKQLAALDWLTEGSLGENHPGTWRWTRKVRAKTVTVALSPAQAEACAKAIANHRRLEALIQEMRSLSQIYLLQAIPGPARRPRKINPTPP